METPSSLRAFSFIRDTKEYESWGINILTANFVLIIGLTFLELWGLGNQIATLWAPETISAQGVSITTKLLLAVYYFSAFNRGMVHRALALRTALFIGLLQLVILVGLWKVDGFEWYEWIIAILSVTAILCSFVPALNHLLFKYISALIVVPLAIQPLTMALNGTAAGLNPLDPLSFLISSSVWVFYGAFIKDKVVAGFSAIYACTYALTLILWICLS